MEKKIDLQTIIKLKLSEKEIEYRQKKYAQTLLESKFHDFKILRENNLLTKVGNLIFVN
jgi:hypothetical protein